MRPKHDINSLFPLILHNIDFIVGVLLFRFGGGKGLVDLSIIKVCVRVTTVSCNTVDHPFYTEDQREQG